MDFNFKGLPQLLRRFPDDASAREFMEAQRWNGAPICPFCGCDKWYKLGDKKTYKCGNRKCNKKYSVTVGTVFHSCHIPLNICFAGIYLMASHKKGISSHQLARDLNITQKSGWHLLHRIREMYRVKEPVKLSGVIEVDETYMARKFHSEMKPLDFDYTPSWPNIKEKGCVFGMVQRKGQVVVKVFESNNAQEIRAAIKNHVEKSSFLFTDGSIIYNKELDKYKRGNVIHSSREYVKGDIHTNTIENFWGIMKRGIYGTYHQVSYKHLQRYCDEFSFRYNSRSIQDNTRFSLSLTKPEGRLKYKQLIANVQRPKETHQEAQNEWD